MMTAHIAPPEEHPDEVMQFIDDLFVGMLPDPPGELQNVRPVDLSDHRDGFCRRQLRSHSHLVLAAEKILSGDSGTEFISELAATHVPEDQSQRVGGFFRDKLLQLAVDARISEVSDFAECLFYPMASEADVLYARRLFEDLFGDREFKMEKTGETLRDLNKRINRAEELMNIRSYIQPIDWKQYEMNRARFGAKGAMLLLLKELEPVWKEAGFSFEVPEFSLLPVQLYRKWKEAEDIDEELKTAWKEYAGKQFFVRSSAVYAEDGELMGAGIYETLGLTGDASFEDFKQAVEAVFQSVDSEQAVRYRNENGVKLEEMCIVLQVDAAESTRSTDKYTHGYVNTMRANVPEVLDTILQSIGRQNEDDTPEVFTPKVYQSRTYVPKRREISKVADPKHAYCLPYDGNLHFGDTQAADKQAKFSLFLSWCFEREVQCEFAYAGRKESSIVQARVLPDSWTEIKSVTFPQREDYIWWGQALGVTDEVLPILPIGDNRDKRGIVVISDGSCTSMNRKWIDERLPKEGAVWLLKPSLVSAGHIETRALERGLTVITGKDAPIEDSNARARYMQQMVDAFGISERSLERGANSPPKIVTFGNTAQSLRVVANGLEARIYPVSVDL